MAPTVISYKTDSDVVKTELPNRSSRDEATLASGSGKKNPGTVLGRVALGAASSAAKSGGNTGNGTLTLDATTPVLAGAKPGVYTVRLITAASNAGTFRVTDPEGFVLGEVAVGGTFANDIKFATADGATDFIVGDGFDITIAIGAGKLKPLNLTGNDGTEKAVAVLLDTVDATSADKTIVVLSRTAEVVLQSLEWPVGISAEQKTAALAALETKGIVARMGV
jgi:hypothetical protein